MEDKIKKLQWFIEFIQCDLEGIEYGNLLKWITDTIMIINFGSLDIPTRPYPKDFMPPDRWGGKSISESIEDWINEKKLTICQEHLKKSYLSIMKEIETAKTYIEDWKPKIENLFCLDQIESKAKIRLELPIIEPQFKLKNKVLLSRLKEDDLMNAPIQIAFKAPADEESLLLRFYQSLEGIPLSALRQCSECNRLFISMRKGKIYCNTKCAMKKANREARKKIKDSNPKKHKKGLESGRERARKSYDKKVKARTPNAKIERRPTKYKDS